MYSIGRKYWVCRHRRKAFLNHLETELISAVSNTDYVRLNLGIPEGLTNISLVYDPDNAKHVIASKLYVSDRDVYRVTLTNIYVEDVFDMGDSFEYYRITEEMTYLPVILFKNGTFHYVTTNWFETDVVSTCKFRMPQSTSEVGFGTYVRYWLYNPDTNNFEVVPVDNAIITATIGDYLYTFAGTSDLLILDWRGDLDYSTLTNYTFVNTIYYNIRYVNNISAIYKDGKIYGIYTSSTKGINIFVIDTSSKVMNSRKLSSRWFPEEGVISVHIISYDDKILVHILAHPSPVSTPISSLLVFDEELNYLFGLHRLGMQFILTPNGEVLYRSAYQLYPYTSLIGYDIFEHLLQPDYDLRHVKVENAIACTAINKINDYYYYCCYDSSGNMYVLRSKDLYNSTCEYVVQSDLVNIGWEAEVTIESMETITPNSFDDTEYNDVDAYPLSEKSSANTTKLC